MEVVTLNADEFEIVNALTAGLYKGKLRVGVMNERLGMAISTFYGNGPQDLVSLSAAPSPSVEDAPSVVSYVAERVARINASGA